MSAEDTFFDGKLLVEANLGRGFGSRGPGSGTGETRRAGGHRHGAGGGIGMGGGEGSGGGELDRAGRGASIQESNMPPIALRLRLTNTSQDPVEVTFLLCKSELGDFAVRPEKLALAPNQSAEPDRMTSRLGLTSDEVILKVGLRLAGKVEQKELVLKAVADSRSQADPQPIGSSKP